LIAHFPQWLDWLGVAVFALSGALCAARKGMDPLGFAFLGAVAGVGGGTLRDLLLDRPVVWIADPTAPAICVVVALLAYALGARLLGSGAALMRPLVWADAVGLAIFAVSGAQTALLAGAHPVAAVVLGTLSATLGGMARDVLAGETPLVLHREIYVTAAALGATVYVALFHLGLPPTIDALAGVAAGFVLRALAIARDRSLPAFPVGARED